MYRRGWRTGRTISVAVLAYGLAVALVGQAPTATAAAGATTAWWNGSFHVDVPGVVHSSDVVLGQPNTASAQAMPLGNGSLGVGAWDEDGLTVQLNRADTLPDRLSPGQIVVPGLAKLTGASDYHGRLDLYDGTFTQSGGGMTATTYVRADTDQVVIDVTGADPKTAQTAQLHAVAAAYADRVGRRRHRHACADLAGQHPDRARATSRSARSPRSRRPAVTYGPTSSTR